MALSGARGPSKVTVADGNAKHERGEFAIPVAVERSDGTRSLNIRPALMHLAASENAGSTQAQGLLGEMVARSLLHGYSFPGQQPVARVLVNPRHQGIDLLAVTSAGDVVPIEVKFTKEANPKSRVHSRGSAGGHRQAGAEYNTYQALVVMAAEPKNDSERQFQEACAVLLAETKSSVIMVIHAETATVHMYAQQNSAWVEIGTVAVGP